MLNTGLSNGLSGFSLGFGMGMLSTKGDFKASIKSGLKSGAFGLGTGLAFGAIEGTREAYRAHEDPFTGEASASGTGKYTVYQGFDEAGDVKYVGITRRNPEIRWAEHLGSDTLRSTLEYRVKYTNLSWFQARIMEQSLINQYGVNNLYNSINSISPRYWRQNRIYP